MKLTVSDQILKGLRFRIRDFASGCKVTGLGLKNLVLGLGCRV
jgi:hypothetical protein